MRASKKRILAVLLTLALAAGGMSMVGVATAVTFTITPPTFSNINFGDAQPAAQAISIKNNSDDTPATNVTVTLTAGNSEFTLNGSPIGSLAANTTDNTTYTIQPNDNLPAGTHTATISVTCDESVTDTAQITFEVEQKPISADAVQTGGTSNTTSSTGITVTLGEDLDAAGFTATNISISDGTGTVVADSITGSGTTWTIPLTSVTQEGNVIVTVTSPDNNYIITGSPITVDVYKAPVTIDLLAIPGVTEPVAGESPVTAVGTNAQYTGTVEWKDSTTDPYTDPFVEGVVYTATITLTAQTGYKLEGVLENTFTVSGATTVTHSADDGVVTAEFPAATAASSGGGTTTPAPEPTPGPGYVTPSGSGSGSGGSSNNSDISISQQNSGGTSGNVGSDGVVDRSALQTEANGALKGSGNNASLRTVNAESITVDTLKSLANSANRAGKNLLLNADTLKPDGSVDVRIVIDPKLATKGINLSASTTSNKAQSTNALFGKYFSNTVSTISLSQQDNFGMSVKIAAKVDPKLNINTLAFYVYNPKTNKFSPITEPDYGVDKNGYVHFKTEMGGSIIITDKPLTKK